MWCKANAGTLTGLVITTMISLIGAFAYIEIADKAKLTIPLTMAVTIVVIGGTVTWFTVGGYNAIKAVSAEQDDGGVSDK
ncbi:MAG: hypothetical protein GXP30_12575 [Verrucomicrobia bacterium]|nr:hypothetical protein [Verrucomicrobiota bacterium]